MAGELSEYAYGKIKIRVMKVNKERSFPKPSPLPRSCSVSAYSAGGQGASRGAHGNAPKERRVDSGRCGALRACLCAQPASSSERGSWSSCIQEAFSDARACMRLSRVAPDADPCMLCVRGRFFAGGRTIWRGWRVGGAWVAADLASMTCMN